MVDVVRTAADAKARRSAAEMMRNYRDPRLIGQLLAALQNEQDAAVYDAIAQTLLSQYAEDSGVVRALRAADRERLEAATLARIAKLDQAGSP